MEHLTAEENQSLVGSSKIHQVLTAEPNKALGKVNLQVGEACGDPLSELTTLLVPGKVESSQLGLPSGVSMMHLY